YAGCEPIVLIRLFGRQDLQAGLNNSLPELDNKADRSPNYNLYQELIRQLVQNRSQAAIGRVYIPVLLYRKVPSNILEVLLCFFQQGRETYLSSPHRLPRVS